MKALTDIAPWEVNQVQAGVSSEGMPGLPFKDFAILFHYSQEFLSFISCPYWSILNPHTTILSPQDRMSPNWLSYMHVPLWQPIHEFGTC